MLSVTITTIDKQLFSGEVEYVICPGSDGELTILENHTSLITTLKQGSIRVQEKRGSELQEFPVRRGLLEVSKEGAVILL